MVVYTSSALDDTTCTCRPSAEHVDETTRSAADEICRTARNIIQVTTDVEKYVLKRFPLTESPYEEIESYHTPLTMATLSPAKPSTVPLAAEACEAPAMDPMPPPPTAAIANGPRRQSSLSARPTFLRADLCSHEESATLASTPPDKPSASQSVPQESIMQQLQVMSDCVPEMSIGRASIQQMPQPPMRSSIAPPTPFPVQAANGRRSTVPDLSPECMAELFGALDRKEMDEQVFLEALYQASASPPGKTLPLGFIASSLPQPPATKVPLAVNSMVVTSRRGSEEQHCLGERTEVAPVTSSDFFAPLCDSAVPIAGAE
jgi:hypothetical protein